MNYDQFWNRNEEKKPVEDINWEDEFDVDDTEDIQEEDNCECCEDDFLNDTFLDEDQDDEECENTESEEDMDDSEMYSVSSLFDIDEYDNQQEEPVAEQVTEPAVEPIIEPVEEPIVEEPVVESFEEQVEEHVEEPIIQPIEEQLSPLMEKIFSFIPPYCKFGTYIRSISDSDVRDIENFIEKTKESWLTDGRDKMFNIPQTDITISVLNDKDDPLTNNQRIQSVGVQMFAAEREQWNWLKLFFELDGTLKRAEIDELDKSSFEDWQWKIVQSAGFELWKSRQEQ